MAQYRVETVTIMAVVIVGVILAIYLLALRRSGWLERSNQFYRCPNPECRNIFHRPAEVKDLSEDPIRFYTACPECGADLRRYFLNTPSPDKKDNPGCKYYFGYLSNRTIPETCLECHRSLDCMLLDNKLKGSLPPHPVKGLNSSKIQQIRFDRKT